MSQRGHPTLLSHFSESNLVNPSHQSVAPPLWDQLVSAPHLDMLNTVAGCKHRAKHAAHLSHSLVV